MQRKSHPAPFRKGILDTLAQSGTSSFLKPAVIIQGQGSKLGSDKTIKGKAKRKIIAQKLALSMVDIAKRKGNPDREKAYWNTYHCQNRLYSYEGRTFGQYCKNRNCPLCSAIRKATMINRYYPVLRQWEAPYFVTLTIKACPAKSLRKMFKGMIRAFRLITEKYRKKSQRGSGMKLMGIKSLESNFNPMRRTYNPHMHLIVATKEMAETILQEWLLKWTPKFAIRKAQNISRISNMEGALIETIKYGSKIFTEPDLDKKLQGEINPTVYAGALYNIFEAMEGLRVFERFGFDLPRRYAPTIPARIIEDYVEWVFMPQYYDWIGVESEQVLSDYSPNSALINLLEHNIDSEIG